MIFENILNEIARLMEIKTSDLNIDRPLEEYGNWDSLTTISTLALIDAQFGILLTGCEIGNCKTLSEIFQLVERKQTAKF